MPWRVEFIKGKQDGESRGGERLIERKDRQGGTRQNGARGAGRDREGRSLMELQGLLVPPSLVHGGSPLQLEY